MDQKRYQKHLAKKKTSHERRTKRVHELDAHPRIYEKPQPLPTAGVLHSGKLVEAIGVDPFTPPTVAAAEAPNGN